MNGVFAMTKQVQGAIIERFVIEALQAEFEILMPEETGRLFEDTAQGIEMMRVQLTGVHRDLKFCKGSDVVKERGVFGRP